MKTSRHIAVLGAGPAGLAAGFYARRKGVSFALHEMSGSIGGNCRTLQRSVFRFDTGAHRLHGKNREVVAQVESLLGHGLKKIDVPSRIFQNGRFVHFPLSPVDLLRKIGAVSFARAAGQVGWARISDRGIPSNFEEFALRTYGREIAGRFLLNYSEKLWGVPCDRLSVAISGQRMRQLTLGTFLMETILSRFVEQKHFEGAFYYPDTGIGSIMDALADSCGRENIRLGSEVTRIFHDNERINAIGLNGSAGMPVDAVISTIPLTDLLARLEPLPPGEILEQAGRLKYRSLAVVMLMLDTPYVLRNVATVYFPGREFPFTRISEPKNRSSLMAPSHQTSLMAEIPCQPGDDIHSLPDAELAELVVSHLVRAGLIRNGMVIGRSVVRMENAYPILETGSEASASVVREWISRLVNLRLAGRTAEFKYTWIHDAMESANLAVEALSCL